VFISVALYDKLAVGPLVAMRTPQATTSAAQRRESLAQLSGIRSKIGMWETAKQPRALGSIAAALHVSSA